MREEEEKGNGLHIRGIIRKCIYVGQETFDSDTLVLFSRYKCVECC